MVIVTGLLTALTLPVSHACLQFRCLDGKTAQFTPAGHMSGATAPAGAAA